MLSPRENRLSSGTSAIWIGTTCSANTPMKRMLRPRNGIHAKAYAASDAITRGKIDAGIVMAIELRNDCPSADRGRRRRRARCLVVAEGESGVLEDRSTSRCVLISLRRPERRDEQAEGRGRPQHGDDDRRDGRAAAGELLLGLADGRALLARLLAAGLSCRFGGLARSGRSIGATALIGSPSADASA